MLVRRLSIIHDVLACFRIGYALTSADTRHHIRQRYFHQNHQHQNKNCLLNPGINQDRMIGKSKWPMIAMDDVGISILVCK